MLVWTLHRWPKAQYLAQALSIPPQAWTIPSLFVPVGGPEISAFEAAERPDLGELGTRLKALAKLAAAAAHQDPWVKEHLGEGILAGAFHPGVEMADLVAMCERDGYRVVHIDDALATPGEPTIDDDGLHDAFGPMRAQWTADGLDEVAILERTLSLPVWNARHHGAAFFLLSRPEDWLVAARTAEREQQRDALAVLARLVVELAQPVLLKRLASVAKEVPGVLESNQLAQIERLIPIRR